MKRFIAATVSSLALLATAGVVQAGKVDNVATFEQIVAKPTAWGREVQELQSFNGKIYAGYGDWNANGRINIQVYDPATGEVTVGPQMGNAVHNLVVEDDGNLYAVGPESGAVFRNDGTDWLRIPERLYHSFDVATHDGVLYWSGQGGYSGNDGTVFASYDGGASSVSLLIDPDAFRFHGIAVLDNNLWVFGQGDEWSMDLTTREWTKHPNLIFYDMMYKADEFAGKIIGLTWYPTPSYHPNPLLAFDGVRVTRVCNCVNFTVEGDTLYVLEADGSIRSTTDLVQWSNVGKFRGNRNGTDARSIAILDGDVYVGATEGRLFVLSGNGNGKGPK